MTKGYLPAVAIYRVYRDQIVPPKTDDAFEAFRNGAVIAIRVLWSREEALREVERLNILNEPKGAYYYCLHVRVQQPPAGLGDGPAQ